MHEKWRKIEGYFEVGGWDSVEQGGGYITEEGLFNLMEDFGFTGTTSTDMRRVMKLMDCDGDMMISRDDVRKFLEKCHEVDRI